MAKRFVVYIIILVGFLLAIMIYFYIQGIQERQIVDQDFFPEEEPLVKVMAKNLQVPWEIVFLPDDDILVTERLGTLRRIGRQERVYNVEGIEQIGEGGLLGLALHPNFNKNKRIYIYFTTRNSDRLIINRVVRYRLEERGLFDETIVIDNIPGEAIHNGGRIAFDPNGYLYIATGDAGQADFAQDINSLAGKILRLRDDGSIPEDSPFGNEVWSFGHRNPQGLAWDKEGRLWATEHGQSGQDELNLIEKGKNYGWPLIRGNQTNQSMQGPVIHSGNNTWAPSGLAYYEGSLFFAGLRGASLYEAVLSADGQIQELKRHFQGEFGRLRAVVSGPDGFLYVSTSNNDGRGLPQEGDDKIIKINLKALK